MLEGSLGMRRSNRPLVVSATVFAVAAVAIGAAGADPLGQVTEYSAGITSGPYFVAAGPDGNMWFTGANTDKIGKIDPDTGNVTEYASGIRSDGFLSFIAAGPDGFMWFTDGYDAVSKIDPANGQVTKYTAGITPSSGPTAIAAGPDGNMWFTQQFGARSGIGKINPTTGQVTEYLQGITQGSGLIGIAAGPDGNMWFTQQAGQIGKINPATGQVTEYSAGITPGAGPWVIAAGPDGNMWFTEVYAHQIAKINPTTGEVTEYSDGITGTGVQTPYAIALGPDDNMWFTQPESTQIGRIDPATGEVTEYSDGITPGQHAPYTIAAGADGNMWFTGYSNNRIGKVGVEPTADRCAITQDRSMGAPPPLAPLRFVNDTGAWVDVFWLNYTGQRVLAFTLGPGDSYDQWTYSTHPWVATAASTGECIGYTLGDAGEYRITGSVDPGVDTDGDGLLDSWETNGIDADENGTVDLPLHLPPYSADPLHKDVFVEVDYMAAHQPQPGTLADVIAAFADAPVSNPDGASGVRLHALLDEVVPTIAPVVFLSRPTGTANDFDDIKLGDFWTSCDGRFGTAAERSGGNCWALLIAKRLAFHYAVFGHSYSEAPTSSGIAELPGNDFMVTVGGKTAEWIAAAGGLRSAEAGTFMHELGHNLDLHHGGFEDLPNCKPNYQSVMTYTRQVPYIDPARPLDYSRELLPTLDEVALDETLGVGGADGNVVFGVGGIARLAPAGGSIDWNGDGTIASLPVAADVICIESCRD
jgi:streptogramin lyase